MQILRGLRTLAVRLITAGLITRRNQVITYPFSMIKVSSPHLSATFE